MGLKKSRLGWFLASLTATVKSRKLSPWAGSLLPKHPVLGRLRKAPQGTSPEAARSSVISIWKWLPGYWTNCCLKSDYLVITEWMFNKFPRTTYFQYTFPSYGSCFSVREDTHHTYFLQAVSCCCLIKNSKSIYLEYPCSHLCRPWILLKRCW